MATAAPAPSPTMVNASQRAIVLGNSQPMITPIYSATINPNTTPTINIPPRNVGIITGFMVVVTGGITNGATNVANRTGFGSANALQNITFTDLDNTQRINTSGAHLAMLNSARQGFGFGGSYAPNLPMGFGNNWAPFAGPATLAANATGTLTHTYHVPLAYSAQDLTGSIYAGVVNATMNLQLTLASNAQLFTLAGDPLGAAYLGNTGSWTGNVTVTVYQLYLDQLPKTGQNQLILPYMDLNTIYDIKKTTVNGLAVGQDFPVQYASFRKFLSTMAVFDNGGTFNSGSDVNYFALMAANNTKLWQLDANTLALQARATFMADPPPGVYYMDHRRKPIDTISYGNMQMILNPSAVNANAQLIMFYEAFNDANLTNGLQTSLPGG